MIALSEYLSQVQTKKQDEQLFVFCFIRKKWFISTPEEVVRQVAITFLLGLGYSKNHITVERKIVFNNLIRRYDIVVSDKNGINIILVECKAPHISLNQEVLDQAGVYNLVLGGKYIWITNGYDNKAFVIDYEKKESREIDYIPLPENI